MEPPFKHAVTENLPTSDCDGEDEVADAGDSKPPSPLSVQQDGGILPVQSPPFENEPAEKPSSTMSDCSNRLELHADGDQSVENSDIDCLEPGTTTAWKSDVQIVVPSKLAIPVKQTISTSSECGGDSEPGNSVVAVEPSSATKSSKQKLFASSTNPSSPSRTLPVKKSVQQLYGQPSWWGDGEDNYSYPHTSLLGAQNAAEVASNKEVTPNRVDDGDDVDADSKPQPRCEAFVIDFGQGESRGSVPGSLSQCVPDRLRRGFDERERLKREREKENELRRQTTPSQLSPMRQNSQRSTRSVALRAANAKQVASGRPSTASAAGGASRGGRSQLFTTRSSTAAPTSRGAALSSTRPTGARVVRANSSNSPAPSTPRRTPGSIPSSPLVRAPRTAGSASVTPRQVNAPRTRDVVSGAINRVSALQATTTRAGVTPARKPTVTGTGTRTAAVRQLSQCTDRSSASRRTAPSGPTKPGTLGTKPAVTVASRTARTTAPGPSTPAKTMETSKARAGSQSRQPVTRGFMSATTSSGAKRVTPVQPSKTNRTAAAMSQKPQPQQTRTSFGPPLGNSAKRPVTTTQLRRPASSTRTPIRRSYTDLADKRVLAQPRGSLPRIQYEASASVMAAIDAYDDPKAYLFYRMFQGSELDETSTDSVFRTFTPEFPDPSARQEESRDAIQQPVSSPEDWPLNGVDSTLIGRSAPETVDPPELSTTNRAQRSQRSSVTRPEPPSIDTVRHSQSPPTVEQTAHAVPITVTQPTASACSPKFQHRPLSALGSSPTENNTLNMSMLVATSVTSLAATYNLDPGETLADRGLITPQPTCADQLTTPRGSLTCLKETEEEQEDEAEHAGSHSYRPLSHLTENHNRRSSTELEARSHRTYVNTDPVSLGQPGVCSTGSGESRRVASITRPTSVGIMGCSGSNAPEKVILTPVEAKLSSSPGLGAQSQRGSAVLLKRPECSPSSTSTSPPSASSQIEATAAAAPSNRAAPHEAFPNSRRCAPPELTSPEPRSTYAPLTDIHNCYRALQQSVNYLIQSQTGLLAAVDTEADRESAGAFGFAAVERSNEYEHGPLSRVGQGNGCSATSQAAARWPPDLTLPSGGGATNGARRSLSRKHRADRKRQSTASLDSALQQRWDDSGTTPTDDSVRQLRRQPQQAGSNFRDPRSASAASGDRRKALTPKSADEDTFRLSSALDRNITTSGDSGLQSYSASLSQSEQKSHPAIAAEQLGHTYRAAQSFRTGSSSVPEPASPTGSGSSHSATHEWCPSQRQPVCLDPSRSAATTTTRTSNPLNRTYDFSGQNGPQILSRITHGDDFAPTTERIQPPSLPSSSMSGSFVNGSTKPAEASLEVPTFDSRTFTRRKGPNLTDHTGAPAFDANSYQAWLAGMSALSQGIDSLSKAPLFRPSRESDAGPTTKRPSAGHIGSVSDLPDSTTDSPMPNEPVRSAFITPIPQRSLGVPHVGLSRPANLASGQLCMQQIPDDPNEAAAYYTLMVDSIRQLSLKLRQCSDKLVQRVNADQSAALISSPTGRRASRASSTDSVPTSTKYALSDALENMRTINHQLKMVDELLFSHGWNEAQLQRQDQMSGEIARDGTVNHARLGQADPNHFTFIPIQPENQGPGVSSPAKARATTDSKVSRAACVSCANNTKSGKANATSSAGHQVGLVQPRGNPSRRALMDEEDEYY